MQCELCSVRMECAVSSLQCAVYNVQRAACSVQWEVGSVQGAKGSVNFLCAMCSVKLPVCPESVL